MTPDVAPCRGPAIENQAAGFAKLATGQQVVQCHVDGEPCGVLAELARSVDADALAVIAHLLPCSYCRLPLQQARELARVRLGKREREVVLALPTWEASRSGWSPFDPAWSRSRRESCLRAIRKLHRTGLVLVDHRSLSTYWGSRPFRVAWLSSLGAEIVARFRSELISGGRIRWDARTREAGEACVLPTKKLVAELRQRVESRLQVERGWVQLLVSHGSRCVSLQANTIRVAKLDEALDALGRG